MALRVVEALPPHINEWNAQALAIHHYGTDPYAFEKMRALNEPHVLLHDWEDPPQEDMRPPMLLSVACIVGGLLGFLCAMYWSVLALCRIWMTFEGELVAEQFASSICLAALGLLSILIEARPEFALWAQPFRSEVLHEARFLGWLRGRGVFYLMLGGWEISQWTWYWSVVGGWVVLCGVLLLILNCNFRREVLVSHPGFTGAEDAVIEKRSPMAEVLEEEAGEPVALPMALHVFCIIGTLGTSVSAIIGLVVGTMESHVARQFYTYVLLLFAGLLGTILELEPIESLCGQLVEHLHFEIGLWINFLTRLSGRGCFYIVVGLLELAQWNFFAVFSTPAAFWEIIFGVAGGWLVVGGLFSLRAGCRAGALQHPLGHSTIPRR